MIGKPATTKMFRYYFTNYHQKNLRLKSVVLFAISQQPLQ